MPDDRPEEGDSTPSVPGSGDDEGGSTPTVPSGEDQEPGTDETTDAVTDDGVHDPAGVGGHPGGDSTGLSGQPDADEFEGAADWSDVDDSTAVDAETQIDTGRQTPDPQGGETEAQAPARGEGAGSARDEGQAGAAGTVQTGTAGTGPERGPGEKYCSNCGTLISQQAVVCPECGVEQADAPQQASAQASGNGNDPGVAALLSGIGFFIPIATGAGQIYNGQIAKGILLTVIQLINVGLVFLLVGIVTYPVVGIIAIYDAYKNADG